MSINGSDKERTFTFYQKHAKDRFGNLLGYELDHVKLEKQIGRNKIDLFAINPDRRLEVYVENQLTSSDQVHFDKVLNIIDSVYEAIIVWVALDFKDYHLEAIREVLKEKKQKYINFYAIEISPDLIEHIKLLDRQFKTHILSNIVMLDKVNEPMKIIGKVENIPLNFIGEAFTGKKEYDFSNDEDIRIYTLHKLQQMIPYFPNIHYEKRASKYNKSLYFGAGKSGLTYICGSKNGKGLAFVELNFDPCEDKIFEMFKSQLPSMKLHIHPEIKVKENKKRKIGVYFQPFPKLDDTIEKMGFILERFIQYFSPYTYAKK